MLLGDKSEDLGRNTSWLVNKEAAGGWCCQLERAEAAYPGLYMQRTKGAKRRKKKKSGNCEINYETRT